MNNSGHGHVNPREDGVKARCGGPALCSECALEFAQQEWDGLSLPEQMRKYFERGDRESAELQMRHMDPLLREKYKKLWAEWIEERKRKVE